MTAGCEGERTADGDGGGGVNSLILGLKLCSGKEGMRVRAGRLMQIMMLILDTLE